MINKICVIAVFVFTMLFVYSCKNKPTQPDDNTQKPGKRDYIWTIDSVDYGNLPSTIQLESMWGSSVTDVWGVAGGAPIFGTAYGIMTVIAGHVQRQVRDN